MGGSLYSYWVLYTTSLSLVRRQRTVFYMFRTPLLAACHCAAHWEWVHMHMIHDRKGSNFISSSSKTLKKPSGHLFCGFDIQVHILLSSKHSDKPHTVFFQSGFFQKINCPLVFCQNISYISSCDLLFWCVDWQDK